MIEQTIQRLKASRWTAPLVIAVTASALALALDLTGCPRWMSAFVLSAAGGITAFLAAETTLGLPGPTNEQGYKLGCAIAFFIFVGALSGWIHFANRMLGSWIALGCAIIFTVAAFWAAGTISSERNKSAGIRVEFHTRGDELGRH